MDYGSITSTKEGHPTLVDFTWEKKILIEMIIAYIIRHALPNGWNPMTNQGAPAVVFVLAFLATLAYGARRMGLEWILFGK